MINGYKKIVLGFCFILATAGCMPAKLVVYHVDSDSEKIKGKQGVFYTLPKTVIDVVVPVTKHTFLAGRYQDHENDGEIKELGLVSKKPDNQCEKNNAWYSLGDPKILSGAVPDPQHLYFAELDAGYFEDLTFHTSFNVDGVPTKQLVEVKDNFADVVSDLIAEISRNAILAKPVEQPLLPSNKTNEEVPPSLSSTTAYDHLVETKKLRQDILTGKANPPYLAGSGIKESLAQLDGYIQGLESEFTGSVKQEVVNKIFRVSLEEKTEVKCEDNNKKKFLAFKFDKCFMPFSKDEEEHFKEAKPKKYELVAKFNSDSESIIKKIRGASRTGGAALTEDLRGNSDENLGLRYRIPMMTKFTIESSEDTSSTNGAKKNIVHALAEIPVAQWGVVEALPAKIGGKSNIDIELYEKLGALKILKVGATGADPTPISEGLKERIKKEDDLEKLKRKHDILDYEKKIKTLEKEISDK